MDISFIIPVFNGEDLLGKAIRSALSQSSVDIEIIVLDDGSSNSHQYITDEFSEHKGKIIFHRFEENCGPGARRNIGIHLARGTYISILDADDYIEPGRSRILLDFAKKTSADIIADNLIEEGTHGHNPQEFFNLNRLSFKNGYTDISLEIFMKSGFRGAVRPSLGYTKPIFKKSTLADLGIRYSETIEITEDYYFVAGLLARDAHMIMCDHAGYHYVRHTRSISHRLSPEIIDRIIATEKKFRCDHHSIWTPPLQALHQKRLRAFEEMKFQEVFLNLLREKSCLSALTQLALKPHRLPSLAKKFMEIILKRTQHKFFRH